MLNSQAWGVEQGGIDFVYVDANVGEAAGGHMGLRLGEEIFHYQFFPDGTFLLVREPWRRFLLLYNELLNRTVYLTSVSLSPTGYLQIRDNFTLLLLRQNRNLEELRRYGREVELLASLASGQNRVAVPYLGLFHRKPGIRGEGSLQRIISRKYSSDYLTRRIDEVEQDIHRHLTGEFEVSEHTDVQRGPQLQELFSLAAALRIIASSDTVHPDHVIDRMGDEPLLDTHERVALERYRLTLVQSILSQLSSAGPRSGSTILRQYARLQSVQLSLDTGKMITLVLLSEASDFPDFSQEKKETRAMLSRLHYREVLETRELLAAGSGPTAMLYHKLEAARLRLFASRETEQAMQSRDLREGIGVIPQGGYLDVSIPDGLQQRIATELDRQRRRYSVLRQQVMARYSYHLTKKNCVTELISSLHSSFGDDRTGGAALGGWLDPADSMLFYIPHVAYQQVAIEFLQGEETIYPSRRLKRLAELYSRDETMLTRMREANTLTSSLYSRRAEDTSFLFFTDDTVWSRPFLGLANIGYSTLYTVGGLLSWPVDGGEGMWSGMRGVLYSLPELFFANIRKGTYSTADMFSTSGRP